DCGDHLVLARQFQHITGNAGSKRLNRQTDVEMHSKHDKLALQARLPEDLERVQPVELRHGNLSNDDVRLPLFGEEDKFVPVPGCPHDLIVLRQDRGEPFGQNRLIIGEKNPVSHATAPAPSFSQTAPSRHRLQAAFSASKPERCSTTMLKSCLYEGAFFCSATTLAFPQRPGMSSSASVAIHSGKTGLLVSVSPLGSMPRSVRRPSSGAPAAQACGLDAVG